MARGQKRFEGVSRDQEVKLEEKLRDTRSAGQKLYDNIKRSPKTFINLIWVVIILSLVLPFAMDVLMVFMSLITFYVMRVGNTKNMSFKKPMYSGKLQRYPDPNNKELKVGKYYDDNGDEVDGMYYLGNDIEFNNEEIWSSDSDVRTHMLLFGTTGAGKTVALLAICYNALLTCSGFIYSDGKGTFELFYQIYALCRSLGQEDDLLLMSFLTGDEDVSSATTVRISNTTNPFASARADAATNMLVSLMSSGSGGGSGDMWSDRASALMGAIMQMLVYKRDHYRQLISVNSIREALILNNIYNTWNDAKKCTDKDSPEFLSQEIITALHGYLVSLAGFDENKPIDEQSNTVSEQHGYLYMQFTKLLTSLADMYGYIFNTQLSEINFWDIAVNRRILVILLPALAKSKSELSMLGKIIVACLKATMESGLGKKSEGHTSEILDTNPTKSETPFVTILDEYGYYAVPGSSVMPAQARGLGFFMIFAGQDLPAFAGASPEEAKSIVANCKIQICMALQDQNETFKVFEEKLGRAEVAVVTGKEYIDGRLSNNKSITYQDKARVTYRDLASQLPGEAHFLFLDRLVRGRFPYIDIIQKGLKNKVIRVNQFIKVFPPENEELDAILGSLDEIKEKITNIQYITNLTEDEDEAGQDQVINEISSLFNSYKKEHNSSTLASCATIAHILYNRNQIIELEKEKRNILSENSFQTTYVKSDEQMIEEEAEYQANKKDINANPIKPFGTSRSKIKENLIKQQMMVTPNVQNVTADADKTIENINQLSWYPRDSMPDKTPREMKDWLLELQSALEEDIPPI